MLSPALIAPRRVELTELAVLVRTLVALLRGELVFTPEQLERDADAPELAVHPRKVHRRPCRGLAAAEEREQARLHLRFAQLACLVPGEPGSLGSLQVVGDCRRRDAARQRDLAVFTAALVT